MNGFNDERSCHKANQQFSINDPITLMLVGGGNRFPAFIGVLQAIEELGINIDKIVASSTAAIVGALYADGNSPQSLLDESLSLDAREFKDISLRALVSRYGLCAGDRLEKWIDQRLLGRKISDKLRVPLEIVATDMRKYKPVVFTSERFPGLKLSTLLTASAATPLVFGYRHLSYSGTNYALVDGSLMTGVVEGRLNQQRKTLVVKVMSKRTLKRPDSGKFSFMNYLHEMLTFSLHAQEKEFLKGGKWKDTILIYCSEISPSKFTISADETKFLYEQGYEQTKRYLKYKWGV
jgi:NTE family protein